MSNKLIKSNTLTSDREWTTETDYAGYIRNVLHNKRYPELMIESYVNGALNDLHEMMSKGFAPKSYRFKKDGINVSYGQTFPNGIPLSDLGKYLN